MSCKPWKTLASETLLDGRYLRVRKDRVELPSGICIDDYHVIESPSWAAIVCLTTDRQLVLVQQYRHGHRDVSLELPAGIIEPSEDPLVGARRELKEETGFASEEVELFWKIRPEPARHEQWAYFALAANARRIKEQALDETEDIRVVLRPVSELDRVLEEMVHAVHVAALLVAERLGHFA